MHQPQAQRFKWVEQPAFQNVGLRAHQAQQACHFGDAGSTGNQSQRDLGQAEPDFRVIDSHAVVAHQRHFPAAAQGCAIEAADHRLAQGFQGAKVLFHPFDFSKQHGRV